MIYELNSHKFRYNFIKNKILSANNVLTIKKTGLFLSNLRRITNFTKILRF